MVGLLGVLVPPVVVRFTGLTGAAGMAAWLVIAFAWLTLATWWLVPKPIAVRRVEPNSDDGLRSTGV